VRVTVAHPRVGVAEQLLQRVKIHALLSKHARVVVRKIVKAEVRTPASSHARTKATVACAGVASGNDRPRLPWPSAPIDTLGSGKMPPAEYVSSDPLGITAAHLMNALVQSIEEAPASKPLIHTEIPDKHPDVSAV